jgi:hypothetical protein
MPRLGEEESTIRRWIQNHERKRNRTKVSDA